MSKVTEGLSSLERLQADRLNNLNTNPNASPVDHEEWEGMSICSILGHLIESSGFDEINYCLQLLKN